MRFAHPWCRLWLCLAPESGLVTASRGQVFPQQNGGPTVPGLWHPGRVRNGAARPGECVSSKGATPHTALTAGHLRRQRHRASRSTCWRLVNVTGTVEGRAYATCRSQSALPPPTPVATERRFPKATTAARDAACATVTACVNFSLVNNPTARLQGNVRGGSAAGANMRLPVGRCLAGLAAGRLRHPRLDRPRASST